MSSSISGQPNLQPVEPTRAQPKVFFGYSSHSPIRTDTLSRAYNDLQSQGHIRALPWTSLHIAGRHIMRTIIDAIKAADLAAFDVTELNPNVMFELGYAIGADRKIWLLRDTSDASGQREWERLKVLMPIGYTGYVNSGDITRHYYVQQPAHAASTIFQDSIADSLQPPSIPLLFYARSLYETDADRFVYRRLHQEERRGVRLRMDDPTEASVQSLAWYAQEIYASEAVVVHFTSPARHDSAVHNARCAFIAGLAVGMERPAFMLAEHDYESPVDYVDLLFRYATAQNAAQEVDEWLSVHLVPARGRVEEQQRVASALALTVELRNLRLGDPVAENEAESLPSYFVDTAAYDDLIQRRDSIFVGRKGTGKTANLVTAATDLGADKRNFVVVIKPYSYELASVGNLVRQFLSVAETGYLVESLWKFLIYTEIAGSAYLALSARPIPPPPDSTEGRFIQFMEDHRDLLMDEFAVRLERAVQNLLQVRPASSDVGPIRQSIAEALHDGVLRDLREHLGRILSDKQRVAVLIDNLDKAWSPEADMQSLATFLLGLLSSVGRMEDEFRRHDYWRQPVAVSLAVFLRSDIYQYVRRVAREPDKLPVTRLAWSDPELLLRVIEERYSASRGNKVDGAEIWTRCFCATMGEVATTEYILRRVTPRPRDIIYYCRAAITSAVNRRHGIVVGDDLVAADRLYSQFALEALTVENGTVASNLDDILYGFYGKPARWEVTDVRSAVSAAGISEENHHSIIRHLVELSFLGLEVAGGRVEYSFDLGADSLAVRLLSRALATNSRSVVLWVHPAFRPYLDIPD